jgi:hypothetical protein
MHRNTLHAVGATVALFVVSAAQALPPDAVIDDQGDAAAGLLNAFYTADTLPFEIDAMTLEPRKIADRTLQILNSATTATAMLGLPHGMDISCPAGGSVNARLSGPLPRLLRLEWSGCAWLVDGSRIHTQDGPGELRLYADDFAAHEVAGIRLGNAQRDHVESLSWDFAPGPDEIFTRNLRMNGHVSIFRVIENAPFRGEFSYVLNGFTYREFRDFTGGLDFRWWTAQQARLSGRYDIGPGGRFIDERHVASGTFSFEVGYVLPGAAAQTTERRSISLQGFDLVNDYRYSSTEHTLTIDGRAQVFWPESYGLGCRCGAVYSFHTTVPARRPGTWGGYPVFDQGQIIINGVATATFSGATEDWPVMNINLDVPGAGNSGYLTFIKSRESLRAVASCP